MKRFRGWLILLAVVLLCAGGGWLVLRMTAEYPALGEQVDYPVNQVEGFALDIEEPAWSPFRGYTLRYEVTADSDDVYRFVQDPDGPGFEFLERCVDGQWYRLVPSRESVSYAPLEFALGGEGALELSGSIVQKYASYGTRLEPGLYRVVLEMRGADGAPRYLAAEFEAA